MTKKIIAVLLAVLMVMSTCVCAFAEGIPEDADELVLEQTTYAEGFTYSGEEIYFRFTPQESGTYYFYAHITTYSSFTFLRMYDGNMRYLSSAATPSLQIRYNLQAGSTYYYSVSFDTFDFEGNLSELSIPITVSRSEMEHHYQKTQREVEGLLFGCDIYTCDICGHSYTENEVYPTVAAGDSITFDNTQRNTAYKILFVPEHDGYYQFEVNGASYVRDLRTIDRQTDETVTDSNQLFEAEQGKEYLVMFELPYSESDLTFSLAERYLSEIVQKVEIVRESPLTYTEYTGGRVSTYNGNYYYDYNPVFGGNEPQIVVTYRDGSTKTFLYDRSEDVYGEGFRYYFTDGEETISTYVDRMSYGENWKVGENLQENIYFYIAGRSYFTQETVVVRESDVKTVEYFPVADVTVYEEIQKPYTEGTYIVTPQEGDSLHLVYRDESEQTVVYDGTHWVGEDDGVIYDESVSFSDEQSTTPWEPGAENTATVSFQGKKDTFSVQVIALTSATLDKPLVITENSSGEQRTDEDENPYWYYEFNPSGRTVEDAALLLTYEDGKTVRLYSNDWEGWYSSEFQRWVYYSSLNILFEEQEQTHWLTGDNVIPAELFGKRITIPLRIEGDPITAIQFVSQKPYVFYEHTGGEWDTTDEGDPFYYYYLQDDVVLQEGDQLLVYLSGEEEPQVYTYQPPFDEYGFLDEDGNRLPYNREIESNQYENPWLAGEDNVCFLRVNNKHVAEIPVRVEPFPFTSLSYVPVSDYVKYPFQAQRQTSWLWDEENDIDYEVEWKYYPLGVRKGDQLILQAQDGTKTVYTASTYGSSSSDGACFEDAEGNPLPFSWYIGSEQSAYNPWQPGESHTFTLNVLGEEVEIPVRIADTEPVAFEYTPAVPLVYTEGVDAGWWYNDSTPIYQFKRQIGDRIDILMENGDRVSYIYAYDEDWTVFRSEDGETLSNLETNQDENQYENPWSLGSDNVATIRWDGLQTTVPVTIKANTIKNIRFIPVKAWEQVEYTGGWLEDTGVYYYDIDGNLYRVGNRLVVEYEDGSSVTYTYQKEEDDEWGYAGYYYADENGTHLSGYLQCVALEDQYAQAWTAGNSYNFDIRYGGKSCQTQFTVLPNPYTGISYHPVKELTVEIGKDFRYDERYGFMPTPGDEIHLTKADGSEDVLTYTRVDEMDSYWYTEDGEGALPTLTRDTSEIEAGICTLTVRYSTSSTQLPMRVINPCESGHSFSGLRCSVCGKTNEGAFQQAIPLVKDIPAQVAASSEATYIIYKITPQYSGRYTAQAKGEGDTYALLYDEEYHEIATNDDDGEGNNFQIEYEMEAGKTYYLLCRMYFSEDPLSAFTVYLSGEDAVPVPFRYTNAALSGKLVGLVLSDGTNLYRTTSNTGVFEFEEVNSGSYELYLVAENGVWALIDTLDVTQEENMFEDTQAPVLPVGDFNQDEIIDIADISLLLSSTYYGNANTRYDLTGDGMITMDDIRELLLEQNYGKRSDYVSSLAI